MNVNAKVEYILHSDGSFLALDDIIISSSFDLYQTAAHYEICHSIAQRRSADPTIQKVLENLYALKSNTVRKITALVAYLNRTEVPVSRLCVNPTVREMLPKHLTEGIQFTPWVGSAESLIGWNHVGLLLAKAVLHRLFRWLPSTGNYESTFVRAWVDSSASLYPSEIRQGTVLVYPFALNLIRQLQFLKWCRREGIKFRLIGLPYSPLKILVDIVARRPNDLILAYAEIAANKRHSKELLDLAPSRLLTSDEFETASIVLYQSLLTAGIEVINTAHGVGNYCPNIAYSEFRVITKAQRDFYMERNPNIRYTLVNSKIRRPKGLLPYAESIGKPVILVLIHQSFEVSPLRAEEFVQFQLDSELARLSKLFGVKYLIKIHPNSHNSRTVRGQRSFQGESIRDWSELVAFRPIFITINSTVFLDVRGVAPVLAFAGPTFDPFLYFTPPIMTFTLQDLESVLRGLLQEDVWLKAAAYYAKDYPEPPLCFSLGQEAS